jgi:hypothetical protein
MSNPIGPLRRTLLLLALGSAGLSVASLCAPQLGAQPPTLAPQKAQSAMQTFVIIFRQGPRLLSDADKEQRAQAVGIWAREQNAKGHKLEPRILAPELLGPYPNVTTAAPAAAPEGGLVTALLFLQAQGPAEAVKIAAGHPAIHYGATVEVRAWAPPAIAPAAVAP